MKKIVIIFLLSVSYIFAENYRDWVDYSIDGFYEEFDMNLPYGAIDEDGDDVDFDEIYVPIELNIEEGPYEFEIKRVSSKLYEVKTYGLYGKYVLFDYSPYVYGYNEGVLEVSSFIYDNKSYKSYTFYLKP